MSVSIECLRDLIDSLRIFLPPDKDFAVPLAETRASIYYLTRDGLFMSFRRSDEFLPYLSNVSKRVSIDSVPRILLEEIDLCKLIERVIEENMRWLEISGIDEGHRDLAEDLVRDREKILKLFKCL